MVKLNKIYTRSGDKGTTVLGTGERIPKYELRIQSYGTVDEANSTIGVARQHLSGHDSYLDDMFMRIQNDLFDLGADLCTPDRGEKLEYEPLRVTQAQVDWLEAKIDEMNGELEALTSFVLPGGRPVSAALHVSRTVCRRAECIIVELSAQENEPVSEPVIKYINRLSDLLFVAARYANDKGKSDVLWVPGKNR